MNDVLFAADFVLTMDAANRVINDGAVLVRGDRIAAVGTLADLQRDYPHAALRKLPERLLMPGLINVHCHSGMLRGTAEGLPVWEWLTQYINPMHRVLEAPEAEAASWLCYAEAVLSGTTTLVDMWRFMDGSGRAAQPIGNRLVVVPYVGAHPDYNYFDTIDDNERMLEAWHNRASGHSGCIATGQASTRKQAGYMAAPERFAKRQIHLAPRAPSIHGPLRHFAARNNNVDIGVTADIDRRGY